MKGASMAESGTFLTCVRGAWQPPNLSTPLQPPARWTGGGLAGFLREERRPEMTRKGRRTGVGADTWLRSSSQAEEAGHGWGPASPAPGALRSLATENGLGASSSRGSPEPCPLVCGHLQTPHGGDTHLPAVWPPAGACTDTALPAHAPWGLPTASRDIWGLFCVFTSLEPPGTSLPRTGPSLILTHGAPSKGVQGQRGLGP